jgi:cyclopropane-fatty-acyl-phospholipid synthase
MASVPKPLKRAERQEAGSRPALPPPRTTQRDDAAKAGGFARAHVEEMLRDTGIRINGEHPWDIQVHDPRFYWRALTHGTLGFGESYMDGWWDCEALDSMFTRLLQARVDAHAHGVEDVWLSLRAALFNLQSATRAWHVGRHYDLGNDLYRAMLGRRLVYSCGYWSHAHDLDSAQEAKLDLVCRKLRLGRGMHVLDIGCGFGEMLRYAAERYAVTGVGITVSENQARLARTLCRDVPVAIRLQDYRDLNQRFDRVVSIGMFEHVGPKNYRTYFEKVRECLGDDGLFVLHTIGTNESTGHTDPWIEKYIFPNAVLPSARQITEAVEGLFVLEDWHNFGADYDRTLQAWRTNFDRAWPGLSQHYDERFRRMWRYYLGCSMATFRARQCQLWQIVLSPTGIPGGYRAPR